MKKSLHTISMVALGVVLLGGLVRIDAASRTASLNMANQSTTTSSQMYTQRQHPIEYFIIAGDTSRGDIDFTIKGRTTDQSYMTVVRQGSCPVGGTIATTGFNGEDNPIYFTGSAYVTVTVSKGISRNSYANYIGSAMISTQTAESRGGIFGDYYEELNMLADEMREKINEWDGQNTEY